MIVRIWRAEIDPARAEEYERFANERSLPTCAVQSLLASLSQRPSQLSVKQFWIIWSS